MSASTQVAKAFYLIFILMYGSVDAHDGLYLLQSGAVRLQERAGAADQQWETELDEASLMDQATSDIIRLTLDSAQSAESAPRAQEVSFEEDDDIDEHSVVVDESENLFADQVAAKIAEAEETLIVGADADSPTDILDSLVEEEVCKDISGDYFNMGGKPLTVTQTKCDVWINPGNGITWKGHVGETMLRVEGFAADGHLTDTGHVHFDDGAAWNKKVEPKRKTVGELASLSEDGYQKVVRESSNEEMAKYATRLVGAQGMVLTEGRSGDLDSVMPYYSGAIGSQSFENLLDEVSRAEWTQKSDNVTAPMWLSQYQEQVENAPVKFFLYEPENYEPRFKGSLSKCERQGADYMFINSLLNHRHRVDDPEEADAFIVPCLFESYRRCTSTNHAEKPPPAPATASFLSVERSVYRPGGRGHHGRGPRRGRAARFFRLRENPHPEDFEEVPWVKAFDYDTEQCLYRVMNTSTYQNKNGRDHVWVVADWSMNFGRTSESEMFEKMTVGRIEVVTEEAASTSKRPKAVDQSRCSFVVPYASDLAYVEPWAKFTSFDDWMGRKHTVNFRFEDRQYVLFCGGDPCPGSPDATPLRRKSLELNQYFGENGKIEMSRVPMEEFITEMHDAKFCLVLKGDTPSSHSFYDALAASCVPILISDQWQAVAGPFAEGLHGELHGGVDHSQFTLQFSEQEFLEEIESVANQIKTVLGDNDKARALYENMLKSRQALLWSMPGNSVTDLALFSAGQCLGEKKH